MTDISAKPSVVCFGEVLWDIFPTYKRIGGAPLNVAFHLHKFNIDSHIITKIGQDELGSKILDRITNDGIPTATVQVDPNHQTGTVFATFDDNNDASYEFLDLGAWDYIDFKQSDYDLVAKSDAFVFGTLASRKEHTRNTLHQLLEAAKYKVYDVNFRPPHYNLDFVTELMKKSDLLKMNKAELKEILEYIGKAYTTEEEAVKYIQDYFKCNEIIVSKGSKGGIYQSNDIFYRFPAVEIVIKDTVGSGDSFLAGFLAEKIKKSNDLEVIKKASSLGAYITSHAGACPPYRLEDFHLFYEENTFHDQDIIQVKL